MLSKPLQCVWFAVTQERFDEIPAKMRGMTAKIVLWNKSPILPLSYGSQTENVQRGALLSPLNGATGPPGHRSN